MADEVQSATLESRAGSRLPEINDVTEHGRREPALQQLQHFREVARRPIPRQTRDRFLILTRTAGPAARNLQTILSPLGATETIVDSARAASRGIWYPDGQLQGYERVMGGPHFPAITSWSRALFHVDRTLADDESIWFVEDDVAGHPDAWRALVNLCHRDNPDLAATWFRSPESNPDWYWWENLPDPDWFAQPRSSFNPLCRVSSRLLKEVSRLRRQKQRFTFHEILFASVALQHGMRTLPWDQEPEFQSLLGDFQWRPEIRDSQLGISHPVKRAGLHSFISQASGGLALSWRIQMSLRRLKQRLWQCLGAQAGA